MPPFNVISRKSTFKEKKIFQYFASKVTILFSRITGKLFNNSFLLEMEIAKLTLSYAILYILSFDPTVAYH